MAMNASLENVLNINTTHWRIPDPLANALKNILPSPISPASLELWLHWILKKDDPKNQGSYAKEVALARCLPLHPYLQKCNFFVLLFLPFFVLFYKKNFNSFQSGMQWTVFFFFYKKNCRAYFEKPWKVISITHYLIYIPLLSTILCQ
jgi:uncharacterized protein YqcC (DUF446 family)